MAPLAPEVRHPGRLLDHSYLGLATSLDQTTSPNDSRGSPSRRARTLAHPGSPGCPLLRAQGTEPYIVSEVLGHAGVAMTIDACGHLVEGQKRTAVG
jgi:hypothetical protein